VPCIAHLASRVAHQRVRVLHQRINASCIAHQRELYCALHIAHCTLQISAFNIAHKPSEPRITHQRLEQRESRTAHCPLQRALHRASAHCS
jgi:hypothetical protein